MRHLIPISGKDSLATALVQTTHRPDLPYEFLFTDTGAELPETYAWLDRVEQKTGWNINRVGKNLEQIIEKWGGYLPSGKSRYCTRKGKIEPMEALYSEPTTVYYGLRSDETRTGYVPIGKSNITPSYPLQDFSIDLRGVYSILEAQDLLPPDFFWKRLHDSVSAMLSSTPEWEQSISRTERLFLFAGRSRGNCFFCFFQRLYEWVWLLETHPDLFERASALEKDNYTWTTAFRMSELRHNHQRIEQIFNDRVKQVVKYIVAKQQPSIDRWDKLEVDNEIALTSCGLLCGK